LSAVGHGMPAKHMATYGNLRKSCQILAEGEIDKLKSTMPGEIRALWPEEVSALSL